MNFAPMTAINDGEKPVHNSENDSVRGPFAVLSALAWALVPTAIFGGLLIISYLGSESNLLNVVIFLIFMLPAGWICEALGLGTFNLLGGMPGAMWPIMILLAYMYGLVLVLVIRGLRRLIRPGSSRSMLAA